MEQPDFFKRFKYNPKSDLIGGGGFGKVFKAYDDFRDRHVAIKVAEVDEEQEQFSLRKEVDLCRALPVNKHIAYYEDCFRFEMPNGVYDYGILQYYPDGNLTQILKEKLTKSQKIQLCDGIINGMLFLYENNIIHRDLKSTNILISRKENELIPKITDFGLSKKIDNIDKSGISNNSFVGGSIKYSAPEQLLDNKTKGNVDIWSLGVILYEIFIGKIPFNVNTDSATSTSGRIENINKIVKGELPDDILTIAQPYQDIIYACLVVDPDHRAKNILAILKIKDSFTTNLNENIEETYISAKPRSFLREDDAFKKLEEEKLAVERIQNAEEEKQFEELRIAEAKKIEEQRLAAEKIQREEENKRLEELRIAEARKVEEEKAAKRKLKEEEEKQLEELRIAEAKRIAAQERLAAERKLKEDEEQKIIQATKLAEEERLKKIEEEKLNKKQKEEKLITEKREKLRIDADKKRQEENQNIVSNEDSKSEEKRQRPILIYWILAGILSLGFIAYYFAQRDNKIDHSTNSMEIDSTSITTSKDIIAQSEIATKENEEAEFKLASVSNDLKALESFINKYPKSTHLPEIKKLLQLKFSAITSTDKGKTLFDYAEKNNSISAYEAFVIKYPNSPFVAMAKKKIAILENQKEEELWASIKKDNSPSRYIEYLNIYPKGVYKEAANLALNELEIMNEWAQIKSSKNIDEIKGFINSKGRKFNKEATTIIAQLEKDLAKIPIKNEPTKDDLQKNENKVRVQYLPKREDIKEETSIPPFILKLEKSFVKINGGNHTLGCSDGNCGDDASDVKLVSIKSFSILKTEVTQAMYQDIMGRNPSEFKGCNNCPVENISYDDALAFITKLNGMKGNPYKYRLPTESEWEYAASGNSNKLFAGSDEVSTVAIYKNNSRRGTEKVTDKKPNSFGLYDMSGNVYEWCDTWYADNYNNDSKKEKKVIRGGSWNSNSEKCKIKVRSSAPYNEKSGVIGFRIVR